MKLIAFNDCETFDWDNAIFDLENYFDENGNWKSNDAYLQ